MKVYAGVIVGGPLDSQRMARTEQSFKHQQERVVNEPVETVYEWTVLQVAQRDEDDIAVWAPKGTKKEEILKKLLARYQL